DALPGEVVRAARAQSAAVRLGHPRTAPVRRPLHRPGDRQGFLAGAAGRRRAHPHHRRRGGAPARVFLEVKQKRLVIAAALLLLLLAPFAWVRIFYEPSNTRDWSPDQAVLARAVIEGDRVTVQNVRNFSYRTETDYTPRYETRGYDLGKLDSLWFVVE